MSALMVARVRVIKPELFQEYIQAVQKIAAEFGAQMLGRGRAQTVLTGGDVDHQITVVVKFPDQETLNRWHESDAYQALLPLREQAADIEMVAYELMA